MTFLFTDIESSTQRWQDDHDAMAVALAAHDAALERCIRAGGGRVFKHTGDGVCAVFESAVGAVAAAMEAQQELGLPVRMGLHTGEAEERDGDFFGTTLNRCARIMDAGHGGQVLMSAVTHSLLDGVECVDLGEYILKGLVQPERIVQVGTAQFPALRRPRRASFLPSALTSLVGRDGLVEDIAERLRGTRLVTLVGMGGVGKTRVALAAAEQVAAEHDLGVFVDLTEVGHDQDVLAALARSMGLSSPTLDSIGVALSGRSVLVVFDNCEHVLDAVADLVDDVLEMSPSSRVLATSREGLAVDGEHLVAVPGLGSLDGESAAIALFVDRARTADASFVMGEGDLGVVQEICRRLDGLPLAIELAAARVGVLTPTDLLSRLDERFDVLTGGRRRRSRDRQRTLRETVDWSYALLDADEQQAFATLCVFAGSFGLDSASAVLDGFDDIEVLDLVEALVAKSLLTVADIDGFRRYRYLETLRSYAEERLAEQSDSDSVLRLLHGHLCAVVVDSTEEILTRSNRGALRLRVEIPNLRRVFDDALARCDVEAATAVIGPFARLVGAIDWHTGGWAGEVLALDETTGTPYEPVLLVLHGIDRWLDNDFAALRRVAERTLESAQALGDADPYVERAVSLLFRLIGDDESSARLVQRAANAVTSDPIAAQLLRTEYAWRHLTPSRPPNTTDVDPEVDAILEDLLRHESEFFRAIGFHMSAIRAHRTGDLDGMLSLSREAEQLFVEGSANWFATLQIRAWAEWELGRQSDAIRTADDDLDHAYRLGDRSAMVMPLVIYALVLRSLDEAEAAATVRGRLPRRLTFLLVSQLIDLDRWLAEQLEPDRLAELAARGRVIDPRQIQALVHTVASRHLALGPTDRS